MRVIDVCLESMYKRLGVVEETPKLSCQMMQAEVMGMLEALDSAIQLAKPRLIMGGIRHGSRWNHKDLMNYMQKKFDIFKETGNAEMLIDLINLCAVETRLKTHPSFHFNPIDRKE